MKPKYRIRNNYISSGIYPDLREIFEQREYLKPRVYNHISRYTNIRRLQDEKTGRIYHENWIQKFIDESNEDFYVTVTKREENRLDIIANDHLNSPRFWWVVALANDITDPFNLPVGTRLRIPSMLSLYNTGGILSGN